MAESAGAVSQKLVGNESFHILTLPQSNRDFQRDANVNECSIAMRTHYKPDELSGREISHKDWLNL